MTLLERLQNNRNALGMLFMLPAAVLLLLFLTYPLGLGIWLGFTDAKVGRPRRVDRARELRVPLGRQRHAAGALQHALLHGGREHLQVLPRPLAGDPAQPQHPLQDLLSRRHPAALHRADGALGDRLLVDLRLAVLDHQLGAREDGPDRPLHRLPRRPVERAPRGDRRQRLARRAVRRDHAARRPADDLALATTRPRRSTARRPGSSSATSRCRC